MSLPLSTAGATPAISTSRYTDIALAGLVVSVIVMMALPLPPWALDMLVACNLSGGVMLLLIAMFVPSPLAFSSFPSVLLISTLFRISLNVATTRQILLHANGGDIIDAFGNMVVGGNLVVGLVVFLIITIVQFIVVAKGAERVAEVSARFTLDALPGKQMSIDADLRAGVIGQTEAFQRRRDLVLESQFYGSMDGAMKFVKGDAIAGIVIVAVNLLGGIAIGSLSLDMPIGEAVQRFAVLSIGDGLVSQLPALFVSIAAGIAITRTASDNLSNLGQQIARQLSLQPQAMLLSALVMALFAMVPGFPTLTFLLLGAATAGLSLWLSRRQREASAQRARQRLPAAGRDGESIEVVVQDGPHAAAQPSPFAVELSDGLLAHIGAPALDAALRSERSRLARLFGLPFPGVRFCTVSGMAPGHAAWLVQDLPDLELQLPADAILLMSSASEQALSRWADRALSDAAPEWLWPAVWLPQSCAEAARASLTDDASLSLLTPAEVVARLVMHCIQRHPAAALGVQEVKQLLRDIEWRFADLSREALAVLPLSRLADLLAALARERVPLNDLPGLLQALVTHGPGGDMHALYEAMRLAMARALVARLLPPGQQTPRQLPVVQPSAEALAALRQALLMRPDGPVLALPPAAAQLLATAAIDAFEQGSHHGTRVLLLPSDLRRAVSRLLRAALPRAAFLSVDEVIASGVTAQPVAQLNWSAIAA